MEKPHGYLSEEALARISEEHNAALRTGAPYNIDAIALKIEGRDGTVQEVDRITVYDFRIDEPKTEITVFKSVDTD